MLLHAGAESTAGESGHRAIDHVGQVTDPPYLVEALWVAAVPTPPVLR